jgi:hypothetical protein
VHAVPTQVPFVSAVRAMPPIAVRSAVTVVTLRLPSVTVQVRAVAVVPFAGIEVGENAQAVTTGAAFDTVRVALPVPVSNAVKLSFAVTVTVYAFGRIPVVPGTSVRSAVAHVFPVPCTSAVVEDKPTAVRSAVTEAMVPLRAATVQVSVVVPVGVTSLGENAQAVTAGLPAVTVSVVFIVVGVVPSVAVTVSGVYVSNNLVLAIVMPVRFHVVVVPCCVRSSVAVPPMANRLTLTDARLQSISEAVQVRVVAATPSEWMAAGENAHPVKTGAVFAGAVVVIVGAVVGVPAAAAASVAVTITLEAVTGVVQCGTVIPVIDHVHEGVVQPVAFVSGARAEPPIAVRFAVTVFILLLLSATVQVSAVAVVPFAGIEVGENAQAVTTGVAFDTVRTATPVPVSVAVKLSFAVTVML